jgi:hypothetical protein
MVDLPTKVAKVTADIMTAETAPVCDEMPSVFVRCFSSPLPEWRWARHVLDHCRAIDAVLTADVTHPPPALACSCSYPPQALLTSKIQADLPGSARR